MSLPPTSPSATGTPSGLAAPDRNVLRSELIRARKALDPAEWERHSAAVQRRVLALPEWRDARTVAMYIAVRNEISTDEIIRRAWAEGKQVLLPRCLPPSAGEGIMEFVLCRGYDELAPGAFGLSEPGPACVPLPRTGWGQDAAGTVVPPSGTDASLRLPDLSLKSVLRQRSRNSAHRNCVYSPNSCGSVHCRRDMEKISSMHKRSTVRNNASASTAVPSHANNSFSSRYALTRKTATWIPARNSWLL